MQINMRTCGVCNGEFLPKRINQRYCCSDCYKKAWPINNREKHNARQRQKRADDPEWFSTHEKRYYRTYRAKLLSARPWNYLLTSRRSEAQRKNIPFTLTQEWASKRWTGCCEMSGIAFRVHGKKGPHPFSPSIDQIIIGKGYTPENSRFVLLGINALKGVGTDADVVEIVRAIYERYCQPYNL